MTTGQEYFLLALLLAAGITGIIIICLAILGGILAFVEVTIDYFQR
jgi:hypothetical protein